MERNIKLSLLFDYYKGLLTKREKDIFQNYHNEDFSLTEIAQLENISKQAVSDTLKRAEKKLVDFESILHLYENTIQQRQFLSQMNEQLKELQEEVPSNQRLDELILYVHDFLNHFEDGKDDI